MSLEVAPVSAAFDFSPWLHGIRVAQLVFLFLMVGSLRVVSEGLKLRLDDWRRAQQPLCSSRWKNLETGLDLDLMLAASLRLRAILAYLHRACRDAFLAFVESLACFSVAAHPLSSVSSVCQESLWPSAIECGIVYGC